MTAIIEIAGLPSQCGECGGQVREWPLTVIGHRLSVVCPHCHVASEPVYAVTSTGEKR